MKRRRRGEERQKPALQPPPKKERKEKERLPFLRLSLPYPTFRDSETDTELPPRKREGREGREGSPLAEPNSNQKKEGSEGKDSLLFLLPSLT